MFLRLLKFITFLAVRIFSLIWSPRLRLFDRGMSSIDEEGVKNVNYRYSLRASISDESFALLKFIFHSGCCGVSSVIVSRRSRRILVIFRLHERWFNSAFVCDHLKLISQLQRLFKVMRKRWKELNTFYCAPLVEGDCWRAAKFHLQIKLDCPKREKSEMEKINRQNFMFVFIFENVKHCQNARPARRQELGKIQKYPTRNSLLQSTSSWWKFNSWWMEFAIRWIYISSCYQQKKKIYMPWKSRWYENVRDIEISVGLKLKTQTW